MILESLFGLSLVLNVSLESPAPAFSDHHTWLHMSVPQKEAALTPLVQLATRCIVGRVVSDPQFRPNLRRDQINDLVIDSISACHHAVDAMIDAHDRMFGDGSGEAFLFGPYLDVLPAAVMQQAKTHARANSR